MSSSGEESSEEQEFVEPDGEDDRECEKCGEYIADGFGDYCDDCLDEGCGDDYDDYGDYENFREAMRMEGRANRLRPLLPSHMIVREVMGCHSKSCTGCDKSDWMPGEDWYVYNRLQPHGTAKYCIDCAEKKYKNGNGDSRNKPNEMIRIFRLREKLPACMKVQQVMGDHRKPCSECGKQEWLRGDWYVFNSEKPVGTRKFCLDCAEDVEWDSDDEEDGTDDDDSDDPQERKEASQGKKRSTEGAENPHESPTTKRKLDGRKLTN